MIDQNAAFFLPMLAQAADPEIEATTGQQIAVLLIVCIAAASLSMAIVWFDRFRRTGHTLPLARRQPLYIPPVLTMVGIVLASLIMILVVILSLLGIADSPTTNQPTDVTEDVAAAVPDVGATEGPDESASREGTAADEATPSDTKPQQSSQEVIETLIGNIEFNLVILMGLGIAVMMSQRSARDRNMLPRGEQDVGGERRPSLYAVDDNGVVIQAAGDVVSVPAPAEIPTERFSFLAEVRFAGEVFLAAWLPTTIVRMAIVLISFQLTGEQPPQHPFFDMLEGDAGAFIILLIVLNAVVMAPIVEELQYRVVILGGLTQIGLAMAGVTMSSLLFAGAHGFPDSLALLPLALALSYAYLRRRSWITVMLVHFLFNAFSMAVALISMT